MNIEKPFWQADYAEWWRDFKNQVRWTVSSLLGSPDYHLDFQVAQQRVHTLLWLSIFAAFSALVGLIILRSEAQWVWLAWAAYAIGALLILWKPVNGVYLSLFLALVDDSILMPAFPFNKNFSSAESIFYINDRLIFSALEVYLVLTAFSWLLRGIARKDLNFRWGAIGVNVLLFLAWVVVGLGYGLSHGGDLTIALWEVRPLFYLAAMYFLVVNLVEDAQQVNRLIWLAMLAIFAKSIVGIVSFFTVYHGSLQNTDSIMDHSASIHINTMLVLILAAWIFRGSRAKRFLLPLMAVPVLFAYLANQRRASYVALGVALLLLLIALYREKRKTFRIIAPIALIVISAYLVVFWNNDSLIGMPARGIRTALSASVGTRDYSSNLYRLIENVNTTYTIRSNMLFGVGFGNTFLILVPMPDISFFIWWQYITHNSILWIWIETGLPGFIAMLLMIGGAVVMGVDVYERLPDQDGKAIGLTMVVYLIMHFIYGYVDMSWDIQSMVYIGTAMGILAVLGSSLPAPAREQKPKPHRFAEKAEA